MPNLYVRTTTLPDVKGRVNYISSPKRQERLIASYDSTTDLLDGKFWSVLAKESRAAFEQHNQKTATVRTKDGRIIEKKLKCHEGKEVMIMLSNALLEKMSPDDIVKTVAEEFKTKLGIDNVAIGLHLGHDKNGEDNLHVHVVFPERHLLDEPIVKVAERSLYFDAEGKRRYKKADVMDENKQLLPGCRIVKKGEIYEQRYFDNVDKKYRNKDWLKNLKTNVILPLRNGKLKGDVEITEYDKSSGKLPQQHIGKAVMVADPDKTERIKEYNENVKEYNQMVDAGVLPAKIMESMQEQVMPARDKTGIIKRLVNRLKRILEKLRRQEQEQKQQQTEPLTLEDKIANAARQSQEQNRSTNPIDRHPSDIGHSPSDSDDR